MSVALFSLLMLVLTPLMANARPSESTETISRDTRQLMMVPPAPVQMAYSLVPPSYGGYPGYRQNGYEYRLAVGQPHNEVESRIGFALLLLLLNGLDDRFASTQQPMTNPPIANFPFPAWPQLNRPRQ